MCGAVDAPVAERTVAHEKVLANPPHLLMEYSG